LSFNREYRFCGKINKKIMEQFLEQNFWIIILIALWSAPWKVVALWKSAQFKDKKWFIVLFVFNTFAILEILYIFKFSKRKENNILQI